MAEAMINEKYMQATLPTLPIDSNASCSSPIRRPQQQQQQQQQQLQQQVRSHHSCQETQSTTKNDPVDVRNPSNSSHQQRKYKVNFELPPTKRSRRNPNANIQNVITAIQTCISSRDRLDAIYDACIKLDHNVETAHDTEIAMGTDIALFKHLPFLMLKRQRYIQQHFPDNSLSSSRTVKEEHPELVSIMEEISNTFTALEMVLRCSADSISTCFARIGAELFPILIEFIHTLSLELLKEDTPSINGAAIVNTSNSDSFGNTQTPCNSSSSITGTMTANKTANESGSSKVTTDTQNSNDSGNKEKLADHLRDLDRASKSSTPTQSCDGSTTSVTKLEPEAASTPSSTDQQSSTQTASKVTLKTCTKIIGHFARVGSLTETLAAIPSLLDTLCDVMSYSNNTNASVDNIPIEAKLNCLWIIANLACSAENMVLMSRHTKIKESLFEKVSHPSKDEETHCQDLDQFIRLIRTRSVAVRAILNLSWAQENKIPFSENIDLVENLLRIASHRKSQWAGSGRGVSGILLQSRRHACGTLRNLAAAPRKYKRRLCRMKSGKFLDILADIAKHDHDNEVRDKIHATLFNLVSADTAKLFTEKKDVLNVIISAATDSECKDETTGANNKNANDDLNVNIDRGSRKMAEDTLRSLEKALPEDDEGYDALRPTLSRFDSQIGMNRTNSTLGSVTISITNIGPIPSISNFSFGNISHSNLNPEIV